MPTFKKGQTRGRFYIEKEENWCLIDSIDGTLVGFDTKIEAEESASFARAYVKRHGDIDFLSFPYDLDQELYYDVSGCREGFLEARPWVVGTKWEAKWREENEFEEAA
jgi:hypothetical protein